MFKNNLKIAIRNLFRQKIYSLINLTGLAVGVASCLLIVLYIQNEFSYDKFFGDNDRIYRMVLERKYPNHSTFYAIIPQSFEEAAKRDYPEIELSTIAFNFQYFPLNYKNEKDELVQFDEESVMPVDSSFLSMFNFKFIKGNQETALQNPNEIVVTEEMAARYFGAVDPIGKTMKAGPQDFKVVGVCENVPANSHFKFNALLSASTFEFARQENFTSFSSFTYFKLKEGSNYKDLEAKIPQLVDRYAAAQIERNLGKSWEDYKKEGNGYRYFFQPLTSIHLDPTHLEAQMKPGGNITSVYIMILVAVLILVIACINFMNLATARSAERAKEVGVRKVMGSFKHQLVYQFLGESFVLSALGVAIALLFIQFALPSFNDLIGKQLTLPISITSISVVLGLIAMVGLLAGIYPAFILSSFNPVVVMKGTFTSSAKGKWIRNGLVIFQFWISIVLMIGTVVIGKQMKFMQEKNLGFDKEQVMLVERGFNVEPQKAKTLIEEIRLLPEVVRAAGSFASPGRENDFFGIQFQPEGSSEILTTKSMIVADGLIETLGLELVEGKGFSEETNDSLSVILNERAVKVMGLENPIGKKLIDMQQRPNGESIAVPLIVMAIVKDVFVISRGVVVTPRGFEG
jgi:putative ABC transport system permease protein